MNTKSVRRNTKTMKASIQQQQLNTFELLDERLRNVEDVVYESRDKENNYIKYIVYHEPKKIYTTIGAKNIHHAFNKATKNFKGDYTGVIKQNHNGHTMCCRFVTVAEFNRLTIK